MSHLNPEIRAEEEDKGKYERLARKHPKEALKLRGIARDERRHEKILKGLEAREAKTKAIRNKIK